MEYFVREECEHGQNGCERNPRRKLQKAFSAEEKRKHKQKKKHDDAADIRYDGKNFLAWFTKPLRLRDVFPDF